jgi:hypothetical protein
MFKFTAVFLAILTVSQAWQYTTDKTDIFGMKDLDLDLESLSKLKIHLKAKPYIDITAGDGDEIPRLSVKIFELDSHNKIYKSKMDLCNYVKQSCPLLQGEVVDINVLGTTPV